MKPQLYSIITGLFGIIPSILAYKKNKIISLLILNSTFFTVLQHLTETLNNNLAYYNVNNKLFLYADRVSAIILGFTILTKLKYKIFNYKIILSFAFILLVICDSKIIKSDKLYSVIHSLWHTLIWYYLILIIKYL